MSNEQKPTLIALPTAQIPIQTDPAHDLIAICVLMPERAAQILRQMKSITAQAKRWIGTYKVSCFDNNTYFVPRPLMGSLAPAENDFLILEPGFTLPPVKEMMNIQIGIIPGVATWEATDPESRFTVSSVELNQTVLEAIASGITLNPGDSSQAIRQALVPARPVFDQDPRWEQKLM